MTISRERMEKALEYLATTDETFAQAQAYYSGLAEQRKVVKAKNWLANRASTQGEREQGAYTSFEYQQHLEKLELAELDYLTLKAKRQTEMVVIDCWRSLNAARNKGQIV